MKAPGRREGRLILENVRLKSLICFSCMLYHLMFAIFVQKRHSPPPFWWQRYGNLHTFPKPTLKPTCANTYWNLESHAGRSASFASPPGPGTAVSCVSDCPSPSQPLSSLLSRGGFSVCSKTTGKDGQI